MWGVRTWEGRCEEGRGLFGLKWSGAGKTQSDCGSRGRGPAGGHVDWVPEELLLRRSVRCFAGRGLRHREKVECCAVRGQVVARH